MPDESPKSGKHNEKRADRELLLRFALSGIGLVGPLLLAGFLGYLGHDNAARTIGVAVAVASIGLFLPKK